MPVETISITLSVMARVTIAYSDDTRPNTNAEAMTNRDVDNKHGHAYGQVQYILGQNLCAGIGSARCSSKPQNQAESHAANNTAVNAGKQQIGCNRNCSNKIGSQGINDHGVKRPDNKPFSVHPKPQIKKRRVQYKI